MKRIISVLMCMCLLLGLIGCNDNDSSFNNGVEKFIDEFSKLNEDLDNLGGEILNLGVDETDTEYNLHEYSISYYNFPSASISLETSKDNKTIASISAHTDMEDKEYVNTSFSLTINLIASVLDSECDLDEFDRDMEVASIGNVPKEGVEKKFDKFMCYSYETTQKKIFLFQPI